MPLPQICSTFEHQFNLSDDKLHEIVQHFLKEFDEGLGEYGKPMAMIPAWVTGVPDGTEEGTFLALDLGGTNLRVCEVELLGDHTFNIRQAKYKISEELKQGQARQLFDYIAECVDSFLTERANDETNPINLSSSEPFYLGFTFSFPVEQTAIDAGTLLTWTKGFNAKNAIGNDVVQLLQDAFDRQHIHVVCSALVNDTVGTLLSRSYQSGPALIGAIFGTGTNGAYIDKTRKISKLGEKKISDAEAGGEHAGEYMVVNTEWGAFDNERHCLPVSIFDNKLDRESINPRKQAFEKMVSGMYLGEITRNILLHMIDSSLLFSGHSTEILNTHYGFDTSFVSSVEGATAPADVRSIIIEALGVPKELIGDQCVEVVQWACRLVADRACKLAACAVAAVVKQTGNDKKPEGDEEDKGVDVGIDGSVAEFLPRFEDRVRAALKVLLGPEGSARVKMGLAKDGSGVGAALTALQAKKAADKRNERATEVVPGQPKVTGQASGRSH
ncbi:hypothetical protein IAT38_000411 [Cryptococcus sp. DSM 104549]